MDMVQAIYNNHDERYSALVNGTLFEISEKAYNTILIHGQGK